MISARLLALLLLIASAAWSVAAAEPGERSARPLREYFQESWTSADGLPHNLVSDVVQTSEGYLWFATWEGSVRYNGHRFDVFDETAIPGLPDRGTTELEIDRQGRLLVGTARGGFARGGLGGWEIVSTDLGKGAPSIYSFLDLHSRQLIGTAGDGLLQLDAQGRLSRVAGAEPLASALLYAMVGAGDGAVWLGSSLGLFRLAGEQLQFMGPGEGVPPGAVLSLLSLPSGELVLGTERGAYLWSGHRARPLSAALPDASIESLMRDRHGDLWIGTASQGLYRLSDGQVEHLDSRQGLPNSRVAALFEDREGSVWVGTNGGLMRLREAPFQAITAADGLPDDYVRAVAEDADGTLWVGTSHGLASIAEGSGRAVAASGEIAGESILSLATRRQGGLWIGTYFAGLLHWRDGRLLERFDNLSGLPSNQVRAVVEDRDGNVWVGTTGGLARLGAAGPATFDVASGLPAASIIALFQDRQGRLWIGTTLGLARFEQGRVSAVRDPALAAVQRVYGFSEDAAGAIWVASDRGIFRWHAGRWQGIGPAEGLPVASVFGVNIDRAGHYWLSSNRGVVRIESSQMQAVLAGQSPRLLSEMFGEADGMASAQCNGASGPTSLVGRNGAIWFGTARGVSWIDPPALAEFPRLLPAVVIEQVLLDGEPRRPLGRLDIAAGSRRIEVQFVGLSFQAPGKIRYRYRLEGFDNDWIDSGLERVAQFTNLPPGHYRFRGSAANANGEWSPHEAVLEFTVLPHWWQLPWVQITALALVLVAAVGAPRMRLRQLAARERRLREQVANATLDLQAQAERLREQNLELDAYAHTVAHDLKTPLTTVLGLARVLERARERLDAEQQSSFLSRIHSLSQKMASIIDALLLLSRARSGDALELQPVDSSTVVDEALQRLDELRSQCGATIERPLALPVVLGYAPWIEEVWVNYLSNAMKYGGERPRLQIGADPPAQGRVRLWLQDHGPGLSEEAIARLFQPFSRIAEIGGDGHGLGLSIVRRIVERMGGRVGCQSVPGQGARFWLELPVADREGAAVS